MVRKGELAHTMYFVKKGILKTVCADNEEVVISYMAKGCYFGEIGVLLGGKRSVSVIAHTNCVLLVITKDDLLPILEQYPAHKLFLESVGRQRLTTTNTDDLHDDNNGTVLSTALGDAPTPRVLIQSPPNPESEKNASGFSLYTYDY